MLPEGGRLHRAALGGETQAALLAALRRVMASAPVYTPVMPRSGRPFSVRMTNAGPLGWLSDRAGYRYSPVHPETGAFWPPIPDLLRSLWDELTGYPAPPECCLINFYRPGARMGLHRDADEEAAEAPVLSVSLGDDALFRIGGPSRRDPTRSFLLHSGDVLVLAGEARHCFHGIDRIWPGTSRLLPEGGRINCTLRRVTFP